MKVGGAGEAGEQVAQQKNQKSNSELRLSWISLWGLTRVVSQ